MYSKGAINISMDLQDIIKEWIKMYKKKLKKRNCMINFENVHDTTAENLNF